MSDDGRKSLERFKKMINQLEDVLSQPTTDKRYMIDSSIKRFEMTFELSWKALKLLLRDEFGVAVSSPKKTFQAAYIEGLVVNEKVWLDILEDRNLTTHIYNEALADEIYSRLSNYLIEFKICYHEIKKEYLKS